MRPARSGGRRRSRCGVRRAFYKKARHVIQKLSVCDSFSSRRCRAVWRCWPCFVLGPAFGRARAHRAPATRVRFIFYLRPRWTVWRPERTHNLRCGQIQKKKSRAVAPRGRESERRRAQSQRPWSGQSHAAPAHRSSASRIARHVDVWCKDQRTERRFRNKKHTAMNVSATQKYPSMRYRFTHLYRSDT
jgi:hypothetical protein